MGQQQFSIDDDGPPRVVAVWMGVFKDVVVTVDGVELARVAHLKRDGSISCVLDGRHLTLLRIKDARGDHLDAMIAGRRLLGSALHPVTNARQLLKVAPFSMIAPSLVTLGAWIHAGTRDPAFPDDVELDYGAVLLGTALALSVLAALVARRSRVAAMTALPLIAFHALMVIALFQRVDEPFALSLLIAFDLLAAGNCLAVRRAIATLEAKVGAVGGAAAPVGAGALVRPSDVRDDDKMN